MDPDVPVIHYSIEQFTKDIKQLADKIEAYKTNYNGIIAVTRGGLVPAGYLSQYLGIKRIYTCGGYFDKNGDFEFINKPSKIDGHFLLVSDLCKTGKTLLKVIEGYRELNHRVEIDIACIHYYPTITELTAKYFIYEFKDEKFVIYPWELETKSLM